MPVTPPWNAPAKSSFGLPARNEPVLTSTSTAEIPDSVRQKISSPSFDQRGVPPPPSEICHLPSPSGKGRT